MILYHATTEAEQISREGFRDGPPGPHFGDGRIICGVWLADRPMSSRDFSVGPEVLAIDIPESVVCRYEQPDDGMPPPGDMAPYRAFLVPAPLNRNGGAHKVHTWPTPLDDTRNLDVAAESAELQEVRGLDATG